MGRKGGSLILYGAILVIVGLLMTSEIIDFLGWIIFAAGIVGVVVGVVQLVSGKGSRSRY